MGAFITRRETDTNLMAAHCQSRKDGRSRRSEVERWFERHAMVAGCTEGIEG
ncbi:Brp-like protein [Sesbania bispinosa]|nr:Brp-like protein [Sesbania bispinosa]